MTKYHAIVLFFSVIFMSLWLFFNKVVYKNPKKELIDNLPIFRFINLKGDFVDDSLLKKNTPTVFIAFHPDCEHCQYEARSINSKQQILKNVSIVFFTTANDSITRVFSYQYGLDTLNNVNIISDTTRQMENIFNVKGVPNIFIYNAEGKLLKHYKGETKIEAILKTLALPFN